MKECLIVFIGSGFGGVTRFLVNVVFMQQKLDRFPWSTLLVNVAASFAIGVLFAFFQYRQLLSQQQYLLLATGFCGGLSTFSTFALENNLMLTNHQHVAFVLYAVASLGLCMCAAFAGRWLIEG